MTVHNLFELSASIVIGVLVIDQIALQRRVGKLLRRIQSIEKYLVYQPDETVRQKDKK